MYIAIFSVDKILCISHVCLHLRIVKTVKKTQRVLSHALQVSVQCTRCGRATSEN